MSKSRSARKWPRLRLTAEERRQIYAWLRLRGVERAEAAQMRDWHPGRIRRAGFANLPQWPSEAATER